MKRVAIIIPAYNEGHRIKETLENYQKYFRELKKNRVLDFKLIIVLNGCSDNTKDVVKEFISEDVMILDFERSGKGFAITEGFKKALEGDFNLIGFVDADMASPANAFYEMIKNIRGFEGIMANRWDKKSKIKKQAFFRRILSRGFNFIVRIMFLFPYEDTQCGCKLFKREAVKEIIDDLYITHWAFDINLLYALRKRGFKVKEIPTEWIDKVGSKVNIKKTPLMMLIGVVRLRLLNSPLKDFARLYDKLPMWMKFDVLR